jgi:hypothetical protein
MTVPSDSAYTMRAATADDLTVLEALACAARPSSDLFSGPGSGALVKQLNWLLGERNPAFAQSPMYAKAAPIFVLEKKVAGTATKHVVAAAALQSTPSSALSIHPLLWDGKESAFDVVTSLVPHLVKSASDLNGDPPK